MAGILSGEIRKTMCGICGIIRFGESVEKAELERMTRVLAHRGPDGDGLLCEGQVGIGHRRLSIIDLHTGRQPMTNEDGTVWITYNGELYNFPELQVELTTKGHHFTTHSDTEVIIHAYEEWGDSCVDHFRGMFAFAIVDNRRQRVFLARDHLGIKPLVYYSDGKCFAFASEIQALRKVRGAVFDLDLMGMDHYLRLQYIPAPQTIFRNVKKLPPAHRMSVTFDCIVSPPEEYWTVQFAPCQVKSEKEWMEELDFVLRDSVRKHLLSDVPFGAFLSGGVDSSAIVAYMSQILPDPVRTYSIGFAEDEFNELAYAEVAAKRWGTIHHAEIVKTEALEILPDLVRHYGEPFGDSSAIPTYYVCKLSRSHVKMVLSGDGADEMFAGYGRYIRWMRQLNGGWPLWKRMLYPAASALLPHKYPPQSSPLDLWLSYVSYLATDQRMRLWRPEYRSFIARDVDLFSREFDRTASFSNAHKVQYLDIKTYLPYDILTKVDVVSMMNGLEVRTPFVDKNVAEFVATMPEKFNIRRNPAGEWQGKILLKSLMEKYYSRDFLHREKMGFALPIKKWFSGGGDLHGHVSQRLLGHDSRVLEFFQPQPIKDLLDSNAFGPLWLLLFLDEWLRQNADSGSFLDS